MARHSGDDFVVDARERALDIRDGRPRVLIVDDEPDVCSWLGTALELGGWSTACATTAQEALEVAEVFRPAVIVLDQRLPDMTGIEVAEALRTRLPVAELLMFSAWLDAPAQAACLALGVETFSKVDHLSLVRYLDALRTSLIPA